MYCKTDVFWCWEASTGPLVATDSTLVKSITRSRTRWTSIAPFPETTFGDGPRCCYRMAAAGRIQTGPQTYIYNPATNPWSTGPTKLDNDKSSEEPGPNSPMAASCRNTHWAIPRAQRLDPATNDLDRFWDVPVALLSRPQTDLVRPFCFPTVRVFMMFKG